MKTWSKQASARKRRVRTLNFLKAQLESNTKVTKECKADEFVLLSDLDRARITREISVLASRI